MKLRYGGQPTLFQHEKSLPEAQAVTYGLVDKPPFPQQPILQGLLAEHVMVWATATLAVRAVTREKNNHFISSGEGI
jgi:hypothetical protein